MKCNDRHTDMWQSHPSVCYHTPRPNHGCRQTRSNTFTPLHNVAGIKCHGQNFKVEYWRTIPLSGINEVILMSMLQVQTDQDGHE